MNQKKKVDVDYDRPIEIAEDIYWVGFFDRQAGLHCNPYLIIDHGEGVLIDGGSRPDFPVVMMKILQTGISPSEISSLIYQHYDPDLCGSIPNLIDIINRPDLKIFSTQPNHMFIRHYSAEALVKSIEAKKMKFTFASGRELQFFATPYAHSQGSFITFDSKTGMLFSSDLFGSYSHNWELFLKTTRGCRTCTVYKPCRHGKETCFIPEMISFHKNIMPSEASLRHALEIIGSVKFTSIAPQHGSVIRTRAEAEMVMSHLRNLTGVGIDGILKPGKAGKTAPSGTNKET